MRRARAPAVRRCSAQVSARRGAARRSSRSAIAPRRDARGTAHEGGRGRRRAAPAGAAGRRRRAAATTARRAPRRSGRRRRSAPREVGAAVGEQAGDAVELPPHDRLVVAPPRPARSRAARRDEASRAAARPTRSAGPPRRGTPWLLKRSISSALRETCGRRSAAGRCGPSCSSRRRHSARTAARSAALAANSRRSGSMRASTHSRICAESPIAPVGRDQHRHGAAAAGAAGGERWSPGRGAPRGRAMPARSSAQRAFSQ